MRVKVTFQSAKGGEGVDGVVDEIVNTINASGCQWPEAVYHYQVGDPLPKVDPFQGCGAFLAEGLPGCALNMGHHSETHAGARQGASTVEFTWPVRRGGVL